MSSHQEKVTENGSDLEGGQNTAPLKHRPFSVVLSDDQFKAFERAYLTPGVAATPNESRVKLGNPTALGIAALLLSLFPLSINWMQWGTNTRGSNLTLVPSYYFVSLIGLEIAGILEWVLGNTFVFILFTTLGGFIGSLGAAFDPQFMIQQTALNVPSGAPSGTLQTLTSSYDSGMGIYILGWAFLSGIYFVGCTRINFVFSFIFFNITLMLSCVGGSYYLFAESHLISGSRLLTAGGAFGFIACVFGYYLMTSLVLQAVGMGGLPQGDLQRFYNKRA